MQLRWTLTQYNTDKYAYTRAVDPLTGDYVFEHDEYVPAVPLVAVAINVLRTPKGQCLTDPELGVDYDGVGSMDSGFEPRMVQALTAGFARYVASGLMTDFRAAAQRILRTALVDVAFVDPRSGFRFQFRGKP